MPNPYEIERQESEHGPEWWAMGAELCTCGHRLDRHPERVDSTDARAGTHFPCDDCACQDLELDNSKLRA